MIKNFLSIIWKNLNYKTNGYNLPVLCYHSINSIYNYDADPIKPEVFEEHIKFFKKKYNILSLKDWIKNITNRNISNPLLITFDDGYIDNYNIVYPIIKKYNIPITIFIVSDFVEKKIHLINDSNWTSMNWKQINEMINSNLVHFAPHSSTHRKLNNNLNNVQIENEIKNSISKIKLKTNQKSYVFAYPFGQDHDINTYCFKMLNKYKIKYAFSTIFSSKQNFENKYLLNRIVISSKYDLKIIKKLLKGEYDYLYYIQKIKSYILNVYYFKKFF